MVEYLKAGWVGIGGDKRDHPEVKNRNDLDAPPLLRRGANCVSREGTTSLC
jgi:hypothetical protein